MTKIFNASVHMRLLLIGIAEFAKTGKGSDDFTPVDLNDVINEVSFNLEIMIPDIHATIPVDKLPTVITARI